VARRGPERLDHTALADVVPVRRVGNPMMINNSLTRQVVLRHRAEGYLRFDLPQGLATGAAAATIRRELEALEGVYRVSFHPAYDKLAIRFHPVACDLPRIARALSNGLAKVEAEGLQPGCAHCVARQADESPPSGLKARVMNLGPVRWARAKAQEMRQTTAALRQLSLTRFKKVPAVLQDPGKAFHEFLTDVIVLYLIRTHWDRITQQWLRAPFRYRYEWLAVFYLTYLWVRARQRGR
jgi:hypothetical protein